MIKNKRDETQTFKSMGGMIPACAVRFVLDPKSSAVYEGLYIGKELIGKYITKNITSLRADKLKNSKVEDEEKKSDAAESGNAKKKKTGKMTAAEFKAMKRKKALQNKLRKLNASQ